MESSCDTAALNLPDEQPRIPNQALKASDKIDHISESSATGNINATKKTNKRQNSNEILILNAVRDLQGEKGCTFTDIKKYLASQHQMKDEKSIKSVLQHGVDSGTLNKVSKKYKLIERERGRKGRKEVSKVSIAESTTTTTKRSKRENSNETLIMNAVRHLQGEKGCSFTDVKKYLASQHHMKDETTTMSILEHGVDSGTLNKVARKYKVIESGRERRRSITRSLKNRMRSSSGKSKSKKLSSPGRKHTRSRHSRKAPRNEDGDAYGK